MDETFNNSSKENNKNEKKNKRHNVSNALLNKFIINKGLDTKDDDSKTKLCKSQIHYSPPKNLFLVSHDSSNENNFEKFNISKPLNQSQIHFITHKEKFIEIPDILLKEKKKILMI